MTDNTEKIKGCHLYSCVTQWIPPDVTGGNDGRFLSGGLESQLQCAGQPPPPPASGKGNVGECVHQDGWFVLGSSADWYLAPTPTGGFTKGCST